MPSWWTDIDPWWRTLVVVVLAFFVTWGMRKVVLARLAQLAEATDNDLDDRLVHLARSLLGFVVFFAAFLWILRIHGVELTPFLAGAGIVGIAVGLAAKETLGDILSGVFLITDRPMRIGDRVKIENIGREWGGWGDVVDVGLRRTQVRNTDGVVVSYPNSVLATSVITNFSHEKGPIRVRVRFQVDYEADLERASEVAAAAITATEGVIEGTAEVVVRSVWDDARGHTAAGVLMEGRYRIHDVRERTRIRSRVLEAVLAGLREAGVPFPAPRVVVQGGG